MILFRNVLFIADQVAGVAVRAPSHNQETLARWMPLRKLAAEEQGAGTTPNTTDLTTKRPTIKQVDGEQSRRQHLVRTRSAPMLWKSHGTGASWLLKAN